MYEHQKKRITILLVMGRKVQRKVPKCANFTATAYLPYFLQDFNHKFFTSFVGQVVVASSQKEFQNHFLV